MLAKPVYETIRWLIAVVLPALGLFIVSIDSIWELGLPSQQISLTLDAIGLLLGTIFGVSKIVNDNKENGS